MRQLQLTTLICWSFLFFILVNISFLRCSFAEDVCSEDIRHDWYVGASRYISFDKMMSSYGNEECDNLLHCMEERDKAKKQVIAGKDPAFDEIVDLLNHKGSGCVNTALVTIMLKGLYSDEIFKKILNIQREADDVFSIFYGNQCLNTLDEKQVALYENKIIQNIKSNYDNAWLVMSIMPTLAKIPPEKVLDLYVYLLKKDDKAIRLSVFINLKKQGEESIKIVAKLLKDSGETDALNFINQQLSTVE